MLSRSSSSTFNEEFDERIRTCFVTLRLESHGQWFNQQSKHNWALLFNFDNRSVMYEASNRNGNLAPTWKECHGQERMKKFRKLGQIQVSPKKIYEKARSHPLNGSRFTEKQSQNWILQLLHGIEPMLCPSFNTSNRSVSGTDVAIGAFEVASAGTDFAIGALEARSAFNELTQNSGPSEEGGLFSDFVSGLVSGLSALSELASDD